MLCLANVLNFFVPRYATDGNYVLRLPVQAVNGAILIAVLTSLLFYKKDSFKSVFGYIFVFIAIIIVGWIYAFLNLELSNSILFSVIRLLSWMACLVFFATKIQFDENIVKSIKFFIITFLLVAAKKVFESAKFADEELSGGDIAGLTLVLALPIIFLFFEAKARLFITLATVVLILITLRRTAIIALVLSLPFIYKDVKTQLKPVHIFILFLLSIITIVVAWNFLGEALTYRFSNLLEGDQSYQEDSYGSGRSIFYKIVFDGWAESETPQLLFGHGIGSVSELLKLKYYDIKHSHNDILEVLYTFGLFGCFVWSMIMFKLWKLRHAVKKYIPHRINIYYMSYLSFLIVSLTSGSFYRIEMIVFSIVIGTLMFEIRKSMMIKKNKNNQLSF